MLAIFAGMTTDVTGFVATQVRGDGRENHMWSSAARPILRP
jgi:hypothetical protein